MPDHPPKASPLAHREPRGLDAEMERQRLEPGLNTEGEGDTGADPAKAPDTGNSNT